MNEEEFQTAFEQLAEQVQTLNVLVLELEQVARKNQEMASLALDAALNNIASMRSDKHTRTHSFQIGEDWARRRMTRSNIVEVASSLIDGYLWRVDRTLASAASDPHETMNKIFMGECDDPRFCWEQAVRWARTALEQYTDRKPEAPVEDGDPPSRQSYCSCSNRWQNTHPKWSNGGKHGSAG